MSLSLPIIQEPDGSIYYIVPRGFPLFKATCTYDKTQRGLNLDPRGFYFFGVKDMNPEYIKDYEKEYGIIFEFTTSREYKLLALDKHETREKIYRESPPHIQRILRENYGYLSGNRISDSEPDRELSRYLCETGYEGYAIGHMATVAGGTFHPELMFCNIDGIHYVKQITTDDRRIEQLLMNCREKAISQRLKEDRKNAMKQRGRKIYDSDFDEDDSENSRPLTNRRLNKFSLDSDDADDKDSLFRGSLFGGLKKGTTKKRRTNNKKCKTFLHKKRKTIRRKNKSKK
jgi:hypothetical protein